MCSLLCVGVCVARADEPAAPVVTPPEVVERVEAVYPPAELAARRAGQVVLVVTVAADGSVSDVQVAESGGAELDAAAEAAIRQWKFTPARRGDVAIVSRIRVPFVFALPAEPVPEPPAPATQPTPAPAPPAPVPPTPAPSPVPAPAPEDVVEVEVRGKKPPPPRASSDFVLGKEVLVTAPHKSAGDLLTSAPGVYVSRPEGEAVAHEIFLRGFDAEHGQDIAISVGGVPVNQPSHLHGQGYADMNFIIPEVVRSLRVTEGVYDPRQGDFAVAGSIDFDLGVAKRGYQLRSSYGSFDSYRELVLWAPEGEPEETFGAVAIDQTAGFGQNRGSLSASGLGQYAFGGPGGSKGLLRVGASGVRGNLAGVLRKDDVDAGRVGFYDSYDQPTANAQSAFSTRTQASVSLERPGAHGASSTAQLYLALTSFHLRENFTGFVERSQVNPDFVGKGDLIEQLDQDLILGGSAVHRTPRWQPTDWMGGRFELGLSFRTDFIEQRQNLLKQPNNEIWDERVDASVRGSDLGVYADGDFKLGPYVQLRGGVRADTLYYDIEDRLGNRIPSFGQQNHIIGFRRTAIGVAYGPRGTLEVKPLGWLDAFASYGEGYRSPQARQLDEGENAPYAKLYSYEVGVKLRPERGQRLELTTAAYRTDLSTDLAFDPSQGRLERIGPTTRQGGVVNALVRPVKGVLASLSVTYVHATLDSPPPATAENPAPAYEPGQALPYVPPVVVRADVGWSGRLASLADHTLEGKLGLGYSYLSARPLPYSQVADPVSLLDGQASLRWRALELGVEAFNLLDSRYATSEYSFVSDWQTTAIPSLLPARHFSAGAPLTVMFTLGVDL
jgi:iron complex outermembrane receptor protein